MRDLFVLGLAIVLIVLGARGTYAQIWNKAFPNMPISTAASQGANGAGGAF
jgi:hypothetical protein